MGALQKRIAESWRAPACAGCGASGKWEYAVNTSGRDGGIGRRRCCRSGFGWHPRKSNKR
ncbi:MAG: hypothetical protein ACLR8P_14125 [Clostridium fessum]